MNLNEISDPDFRLLGEQIVSAMAYYHVPGVAVGVMRDGEEFTAGFGVTNVDHPLPVDADTLFQIGSTTKTFTATLAMRLVEMGKLDLDAPIRQYLPNFRLRDEDVAARVTMRHLLTHTGGWLGDYFDDLGDGDDALAKYVAAMVELPQLTPLGTIWSYNNAGFGVAGRVIEVITGKTYEAALKEYVLDPLDLKMSFIFPKDVMTYRFAVGHNVIDDQPQVARPWPIARTGNCVGGIASTVKDQLRYARYLMGDGSPLLSREALAQMQTPQTDAALGEKMGISFFIRDARTTPILRHGGATNGQMSAFIFVPSHKFAITILTNSNRGVELHNKLTRWALEHFLGISDTKRTPIAMTDAQLAEYAGRYTSALADIDLKIENGNLVMNTTPKGGFPKKDSPPGPTPPPSHFVFIGSDRILALDGWSKDLQGEFLRDADGKIAWFRFGSRIRAKEK
ncbi:MAG: beta-lactamase family protein [Chloroflexi bacterium]|nr:beta-lactamase family protein [Chloroflexota bacterium]